MKLFTQKRERGRVIQNLLVIVEYRTLPTQVQVSRSRRNNIVIFQWNDLAEPLEDVPYVHSEALREEFFAVSTPDQAEAFLKASGPFRTDGIEVTWPNFQAWQEYFKLQRRLGAAGKGWGAPPEHRDMDLLDRIVRVPKFEPLWTQSGPSILAARAFCAVECIAACNYIERWSKTVVMACRQCGDPFAPKTKASVFCSHTCAHSHWRAKGKLGVREGGKRGKASK